MSPWLVDSISLARFARLEHSLLIDCVRSAMVAPSAMGSLQTGSLDWPYLIAQADRHGVLPLLAKHIENDELRARSIAIAAHNLSLSAVLRELVELLESSGMPVVPFKGPALAASVFGDVANRQFDDLDVLVRREDVWRVSQVLRANGYIPRNPLDVVTLRSDKHLLFTHERSGTLIEVHWALAPGRFGLAFDGGLIWSSVDRVTVAGKAMRSVPSDVLLVMLSIHGARHEWRRLAWIADVAAVVHHSRELPWQRLQAEAHRMGATRLVHLALSLADRLFGLPLPTNVRRAIVADRTCRALSGRIVDELFVWPPTPPSPIARAVFDWHSRERLVDRCRSLLGLLLQPTRNDVNALQLPAALSWIHSGLRPFRLAAWQIRRSVN